MRTKSGAQLKHDCALSLQSYADTQAIGAVGHHELKDRRGRFEAAAVAKIKDAIRWAFDLSKTFLSNRLRGSRFHAIKLSGANFCTAA
jgi:hypothetical protein